jgi:hypothetical protein
MDTFENKLICGFFVMSAYKSLAIHTTLLFMRQNKYYVEFSTNSKFMIQQTIGRIYVYILEETPSDVNKIYNFLHDNFDASSLATNLLCINVSLGVLIKEIQRLGINNTYECFCIIRQDSLYILSYMNQSQDEILQALHSNERLVFYLPWLPEFACHPKEIFNKIIKQYRHQIIKSQNKLYAGKYNAAMKDIFLKCILDVLT